MKTFYGTRLGLLPLRLLVIYVLSICFIPTLGVLADFGDCEATIEDWNGILGWSFLFLSPLLWLSAVAAFNFKRIPLLGGAVIGFTIFHIFTTLDVYSDGGFDKRFEWQLEIAYPLRVMLIWSLPFLLIYACWRRWPTGTQATMKKGVQGVGIALGVAVAVYLLVAIPSYLSLEAHQPHLGDPTNGDATSFPPLYAFFIALPYAGIAFAVTTLISWFGFVILFWRNAQAHISSHA